MNKQTKKKIGRPVELDQAQRVNVTLDAGTFRILERLDKNRSLAIRKLASWYEQHKELIGEHDENQK